MSPRSRIFSRFITGARHRDLYYNFRGPSQSRKFEGHGESFNNPQSSEIRGRGMELAVVPRNREGHPESITISVCRCTDDTDRQRSIFPIVSWPHQFQGARKQWQRWVRSRHIRSVLRHAKRQTIRWAAVPYPAISLQRLEQWNERAGLRQGGFIPTTLSPIGCGVRGFVRSADLKVWLRPRLRRALLPIPSAFPSESDKAALPLRLKSNTWMLRSSSARAASCITNKRAP